MPTLGWEAMLMKTRLEFCRARVAAEFRVSYQTHVGMLLLGRRPKLCQSETMLTQYRHPLLDDIVPVGAVDYALLEREGSLVSSQLFGGTSGVPGVRRHRGTS